MAEPTLVDLLNTIRNHYVDLFRVAIRDRRSFDVLRLKKPAVAVGLQLAVGDGSNPQESRFNLPFRIDMMMGSAKAPKTFKVEHDKRVGFDPISAGFPDGFAVAIEPFSWDSCDVLAEGDLGDWQLPLEWFERWFDRDDKKAVDADGIAPVIHEMTEPEATNLGTAFTVDFGAAPIDAFVDLMLTLHKKGMTHIRVGTFYQR
jgi:hypothetical protein